MNNKPESYSLFCSNSLVTGEKPPLHQRKLTFCYETYHLSLCNVNRHSMNLGYKPALTHTSVHYFINKCSWNHECVDLVYECIK